MAGGIFARNQGVRNNTNTTNATNTTNNSKKRGHNLLRYWILVVLVCIGSIKTMGKIITINNLLKLRQEKARGKKVVLAGGSFDIIHAGHIEFLNKAKRQGDILALMLESDEKIRELKGNLRPVNNQKDRSFVLSSLAMVDYIILLPYFKTDRQYELLVKKVQPDIIAVVKEDPILNLKERYAKDVKGKIVKVIDRIENYSTTEILRKI